MNKSWRSAWCKKLNSATTLIQIQPRRLPHGDYVLHRFGDASRPWTVAMEATIFTAWIYENLKPHAAIQNRYVARARNFVGVAWPMCWPKLVGGPTSRLGVTLSTAAAEKVVNSGFMP